MIYQASQELADILLKNGFEDKSGRKQPGYLKRTNQANGHPGSIKWKFVYKSYKEYILIDRTEIRFFLGSSGEGERKTSLTENELKSAITYFQLPVFYRWEFKHHSDNILNLFHYYQSICELPAESCTGLQKCIKTLYESIKLN